MKKNAHLLLFVIVVLLFILAVGNAFAKKGESADDHIPIANEQYPGPEDPYPPPEKPKPGPKKPYPGPDKITICHKHGKGKSNQGYPAPENFKTIRVSRSALDAHLAHGDYIGACR